MTIGYVANVDTENFSLLESRVLRHLKSLDLPDGFELSTRPGCDEDPSAIKSGILAGVLALLLVFFIMGMLFESFVLPFSVILTIPFAFFGSAWALYFADITLDPVGIVGFIMLVGVVVNNAIVLVDTINRRRTLHGLERTEAILESARVRFRPIWMTALTTIFGLLPLVLLPQQGEGIDYKAMAIVLMGGLTTSTFFTLFVVPLFYTILDDLQRATLTLLFGARAEPDAPEKTAP
jgi:HAE1 family hydrophobic/amphiphilic exporter-1